jgi:zinc protease
MYLVDDGLTVGWSLPRSGPALTVLLPGEPLSPAPRPTSPPAPERPIPLVIPGETSTLGDYRPRRSVLPCGLRLLTEERPGTGTVALDLYVDAGQLREAKPGLAHLTGRVREEGTLTRSAEALAAAIEDVGGTLDVGGTGVSLRVRSEDLALAVEILADLVLRPAFAADALPWAKRRTIAELQGDRDDRPSWPTCSSAAWSTATIPTAGTRAAPPGRSPT